MEFIGGWVDKMKLQKIEPFNMEQRKHLLWQKSLLLRPRQHTWWNGKPKKDKTSDHTMLVDRQADTCDHLHEYHTEMIANKSHTMHKTSKSTDKSNCSWTKIEKAAPKGTAFV